RGELDDANTRKVAMRAEFEQVPQFLELDGAPQVVIDGERRTPSELDMRIFQLQKTLDDLQLRYTDQHPDVISARRMLAELKEQREKLPAGSATPADPGIARPVGSVKQKVTNQVYEQLQLKLIEIQTEIQTLERRVGEQQAEVDRLVALSN